MSKSRGKKEPAGGGILRQRIKEIVDNSPGLTRVEIAIEVTDNAEERERIISLLRDDDDEFRAMLSRLIQDYCRMAKVKELPPDEIARIGYCCEQLHIPGFDVAHAPRFIVAPSIADNGENVPILDATVNEWRAAAHLRRMHSAAEAEQALIFESIADQLDSMGLNTMRELADRQ